MSRIGKRPIIVPDNVTVSVTDGLVVVKGPKGELREDFGDLVKIEMNDKEILVTKKSEIGLEKAMQGTAASLIRNMIEGVTEGFKKSLELIGVGFRVAKKDNGLEMALGLSHPVVFNFPEGIECTVEKNTINISGASKQLVGEVAANIRKLKKPEPYKGKGIKYSDEVVRRKAGKAGKVGG